MIWQLVKREPAWRQLYGYVAVVALACLAMPKQAGMVFIIVVGMSWVQNRPAERASAFQAGLPIAAADVFLSRLLAFFALVWLPAAAGVATLLASGNPTGAGQLTQSGAALTVLVLACLSHRVRRIAGSRWAQGITFTIMWASAWPVSKYFSRDMVLLVCASLSALLFAYIWMQLPASFEVAGPPPVEDGWQPLPPRPAPVGAQTPAARRWIFGSWLPVLRSILPPSAMIFLPVVVLQYLSGQWLFAASMCIFPMIGALTRLEWSRGLPLSRSALLTLIVGPWILAITLNLSLGAVLFNPRTPIQFDFVAGKLSAVRPPLEYWHIAPAGKAPPIHAPWGESWQPPVETAGGIPIYNPYGMEANNSRRFLEWQYSRATLAIYGQALEFNDHHPLVGVQPLTRQARFIALNSAIGLCWLLCLVNIVLLSIHWRVRRVFEGAYTLAVWLLLAPMLVALALEILVKGPGGSVGTALLHAGLNSILAVLPTGVAPVLLAAAVPFGLLWWTALRLFDGVEIPPADPTVRS